MNIYWLKAVLFDWLVIIFAFTLSYISYYLIPLSILIIGNRQHALGILGHDGAHQLVYPKNRFKNDLITNILTFYPLGLCLTQYRKFHWDHHRNTNNDKDPEILLKKTKPNQLIGPVTRRKVILHGIMDLLGFGIPHIVAFLIYVRPRNLKEATANIVLGILIIIFILFKLYMIPILWVISMLTSFWFFFRLRVWTEHVGLKEGETLRFTPTFIERMLFLPHNTEYHYEHHESPGVSFDKLPELRKEKFPKLKDII